MRWILPALLASVLVGCSPPGPRTVFVLEPADGYQSAGSMTDAGEILRDRLADATGLPNSAISVEISEAEQPLLSIVLPASAGDSARPVVADAARSGGGLAFHLVHDQDPAVVSRIQEGNVITGFALFPTRSGDPAEIAAAINPVLGRVTVANAYVQDHNRGIQLHVQLDAEGGRKMHDVTAANIGKRVAIILDGEVLTAPRVNEPFGAGFVITGDFERDEIEAIAVALKNGPLPAPLRLVSESTSEN